MSDLSASQILSSREETRLRFKEARRELDWAKGRYGRAQDAVEAGKGSAFELNQARQSWSWAQMEWVRALIARESSQDGLWWPDMPGVEDSMPGAGWPAGIPVALSEARHQVEQATDGYERIRRGNGSRADLIRARRVWAMALTAWAQALIAREEARDRLRLVVCDDWEMGGSQIALDDVSGSDGIPWPDAPSPTAADAPPRIHELVPHARESSRADNSALRDHLPRGKPMPPGRVSRSPFVMSVSERRFRLIVAGRVTVLPEIASPPVRRLRAGDYLRISCGTVVEHCEQVRRVELYTDFDSLLASEGPIRLDPDQSHHQQLAMLRGRYGSGKEARGVLAIDIGP
ncbi:hypothetical protein [Streptosporangium sp. NPDC003464]